MRELVKLPVLFQHYFEHKELNNQITFLNYVVDHYNEVPHTDNDEERDNQLPFKSTTTQTACVQSSLAIPQNHQILVKVPVRPLIKLDAPYVEYYIPNSYQSKIWQPPKV